MTTFRVSVLVLYGVAGLFVLAAFSLVLLKSWWIAMLLVAVLLLASLAFFVFVYYRVGRNEASEKVAEPGMSPAVTAKPFAPEGRRVESG